MPQYVLMTKLSPDVMADPRGRKAVGKEWLHKVAQQCPRVEWISHYALLGRYDFMDIYEAPDLEMAFRVSHLSRLEGAVEAESWPALQYQDYLDLVEKL